MDAADRDEAPPPRRRRISGDGLAGGRGAEILPQTRRSGPIPWVIAIMVGLMVIAAAGALALRNAGQAAAAELSGGITVQLLEPRPEVRADQTRRAVAILRAIPGVSEVRQVPEAQLDSLIEPWLGRDAAAGSAEGMEIPVPALIDARLSGRPDPARIGAIEARLRQDLPSARVDAQSTWLKPVFGAIESLQWLALALIALLALATGAAVLLAARTALGANRATIEIVHLLGGTDVQIARIFQRSTALDAAGGGLVGMAVASAVIVLLGRTFAALQAGIVTGGGLGWRDWALLVLIPLAAVGLATLTARWTVMRALKGML